MPGWCPEGTAGPVAMAEFFARPIVVVAVIALTGWRTFSLLAAT
jgi:hypothetical protein